MMNTHSPSLSQDSYMLPPHTLLDNRYEIQHPIGSGGFSILYKAYDHKLQSIVAIKEYFPHTLAERLPCTPGGTNDLRVLTRNKEDELRFRQGMEKFIEEAHTMVKLQGMHNTVHVYGLCQENSTCYIIMEYLEGCTVMEFLRTLPGERMENIEDAKQIIYSVAEALQYVHSLKLLHRDVSPDNIFLCANGGVKLIDFGAAREINENGEMSIVVKAGCTPPEQYRKKGRQGPWTDMYALGATFYRMLTGSYPETAPDRIGASDAYAVPSAVNPLVPESIDLLIQRCLAYDYTLRVRSAAEVLEVLDKGNLLPPISAVRQRRTCYQTVTGILIFLCILLLLAISGVLNAKAETLYNTNISPCTVRIAWPENITSSDGCTKLQADFAELYPQITWEFSPAEDTTADICRYDPAKDWLNLSEMQELQESVRADHVVLSYDAVLYYGHTAKAYSASVALPSENQYKMLPVDHITEDYTQFLQDGNAACIYKGSIHTYRQMQTDLAGLYHLWIPDDSLSPICLSISADVSGNQAKAAMRVLLYLISEQAQDILFIENDGIIPAEENTYHKYFDIHGELALLREQVSLYEKENGQ